MVFAAIWTQSPTAVPLLNIASKLGEVNFQGFKLLVSHEFHFDWHEELYEDLESNVIRSDGFAKLVPMAVERLLAGSRVILCTISMLSNPSMQNAGFMDVVPVENILVDEASQIDIGNYLHVAHAFRSTLRRLVFVGDDKQPSFSPCTTSLHVVPASLSTFILVQKPESAGLSIQNQLETGKRDFRIITPYDAQRKVLEDKLKATDVRWEDTVFCVDSFQGNEADYIIVSLVRTKKPGFMTNTRRTNVMLTRCKKGVYVCAKRAFLQSPAAKDTLVGKMAKEWGSSGWIRTADVVNGRI
ncbi:hypothetical protein AURDEDRAFT_138789 [Auricularia subglabra TFB-10046 SS5]|nr:hypothetical protein AURDEDRAFT_138789 [Auricularia subglabra TFB-10046 SS5]